MSDISEWSTKEEENTNLDELTLSGEGGQYINKIMCAVKGVYDDLSASGVIGNGKSLTAPVDYNDLTDSGVYYVPYSSSNTNGKSKYGSLLVVFSSVNESKQPILSQFVRRTTEESWYTRRLTNATWSDWHKIIDDTSFGDGIVLTGGVASVPVYDGATESDDGTTGLVPPATSAERTYFLNGAGEWVDLLTLINGGS